MKAESGTRCAADERNPWDRLTGEMRRIKESSELSYAGLAQRTHYSRSSWERFLNQKQLPTRLVVEQFAHAAGHDPGPLLEQLDRCLRDSGPHPSPGGHPGPAAPGHAPSPGAPAPARLAPADLRALALVSAAGMVLGGVLTLAVARAATNGAGLRGGFQGLSVGL
ncbi:helix-turn-helix domain-containing protein [Streptomyces sp. NPDC056361]|uniref:helix-turn-helix domain-containing protein n=1 Tax=Streptomyces sp. NPDC056361 TaxID=3345795 RepID=UPI0035DA00B8